MSPYNTLSVSSAKDESILAAPVKLPAGVD
jgi:hypothetical protein